jgi:four helix bundle protein
MEKVESLNRFSLEKRLISFAVMMVEIVEGIPSTKVSNHLGGQFLCSGTSTGLNYGEAHGGESRKDFIGKMKAGLKELRETNICLKIILRTNQYARKKELKMRLMKVMN